MKDLRLTVVAVGTASLAVLGAIHVWFLEWAAKGRWVHLFGGGTPLGVPLKFAAVEAVGCMFVCRLAFRRLRRGTPRGMVVGVCLIGTICLLLYNLHVLQEILYVT